jgi:hypothetical protein
MRQAPTPQARGSILAPGHPHNLVRRESAERSTAAHVFQPIHISLSALHGRLGLGDRSVLGAHAHVHSVARSNLRRFAHRLGQSDSAFRRDIGCQFALRNTGDEKSNTLPSAVKDSFRGARPGKGRAHRQRRTNEKTSRSARPCSARARSRHVNRLRAMSRVQGALQRLLFFCV